MGSFGPGGGGGGGAVTKFTADTGTAIPSIGNINLFGGTGVITAASGNTVTISIDDTAVVTSVTGTVNEITAAPTVGDVILSTPVVFIAPGSSAAVTTVGAGTNFLMPTTTSTAGQIIQNGTTVFHTYGTNNIFLGNFTGDYTLTGGNNLSIGFDRGSSLTSGSANVMIGSSAGSVTSGNQNVLLGDSAGSRLTTGSSNTILGNASADNMVSGSNNIIIGCGNTINSGSSYGAGESSNILVGNAGISLDANIMRLGTTGNTTATVIKCFIAAIYNTSIGATNHIVSVDSDGQLGLASGPESFTWNDVTSGSQTMVPNNGYVADFGTLITFTLPTTAAFGTLISVVGLNTGGWIIAQNSGQNIQFGNLSTTHGASGSLASTNQYDQVDLLCIVANLTWTIRGPISNLTIV